jgi:hypothetical protein
MVMYVRDPLPFNPSPLALAAFRLACYESTSSDLHFILPPSLMCVHINAFYTNTSSYISRGVASVPPNFEAVRLAYLGISRFVLAYFLSQNTIRSTSRVLFIQPAEHPLYPLCVEPKGVKI